jgi:hypothetical protein
MLSKKAMLGYLPHCADNGREPTSVAFMSKEESMHRFLVGLVRLQLEIISTLVDVQILSPKLV